MIINAIKCLSRVCKAFSEAARAAALEARRAKAKGKAEAKTKAPAADPNNITPERQARVDQAIDDYFGRGGDLKNMNDPKPPTDPRSFDGPGTDPEGPRVGDNEGEFATDASYDHAASVLSREQDKLPDYGGDVNHHVAEDGTGTRIDVSFEPTADAALRDRVRADMRSLAERMEPPSGATWTVSHGENGLGEDGYEVRITTDEL